VPIVDRTTGVVREAQLFVAVFGASNYTFVMATEGQDLRSWIGAHEEAFRFFGGVPRIVVPDNLKAGVSKAHRYEPDVNPTYQDMAEHYGVAVVPTRTAQPRDKAKAENGVLVAERWILARLRNRTFFSIGELNEAIGELLDALNERRSRSCRDVAARPSRNSTGLRSGPLPSQRYVFAEWRKRRAGLDYHVEVDGHYYSVPFREAKKVFDVRVTANTVECFLKGRRVASHVRSPRPGQHTTVREHMPKAHQQYAEWTPERIAAGLRRSDRPPPNWHAPSSARAGIPNKATGRVWASCGSPKPMERSGLRRPAGERSPSALEATRALPRSSKAASTSSRFPVRRATNRSNMRTSAAPSTTSTTRERTDA
jgi:transposase